MVITGKAGQYSCALYAVGIHATNPACALDTGAGYNRVHGAGSPDTLAADIRNAAVRQMTMVVASEGEPMPPPLLANTVWVTGAVGRKAPSSLQALFAQLLDRPQGYVAGTTLTVSL